MYLDELVSVLKEYKKLENSKNSQVQICLCDYINDKIELYEISTINPNPCFYKLPYPDKIPAIHRNNNIIISVKKVSQRQG
jgi:hypothetical protein